MALEVANARHGPEANLGEEWPADGLHDHLVDGLSFAGFLDYDGVAHPPGAPTVPELEVFREIADAARALPAADAVSLAALLEPVLTRHTFRLAADGTLVPTSDGWLGFAAEAARGLVELAGLRERLSVCANPACEWLFLDESRNHSRQWCSMGSCGSRAKMARYRRRKSNSSAAGRRDRPGTAGSAPISA